jgi:hypothetical protein
VPVPDGWSERTATSLIAPPAGDGYAPNVVVTRERLCDGMGLGGFADGHGNLIQEHAPSYAVLATEHGEIDGERALLRTVRFSVGQAPPVLQLQAFCVRDGYGYAVIGTAGEESFAEAEPVFRATLESFRFTRETARAG